MSLRVLRLGVAVHRRPSRHHHSDIPVTAAEKMASAHEWHAGELHLQTALGHKDAVAGAHSIFRPQLTAQHQSFHTSLALLPVCTLDAAGRPWASFLTSRTGEHGFIKSPSFTSLIATDMSLHNDHPVEIALKEGAKFGMTSLIRGGEEAQGPALKLIAAVGVEFETRRRNKFSGFINERNLGSETDRTIQVEVMESLGNCPKYINTRSLIANQNHDPKVLHKGHNLALGQALPKETLEHVARADTLFLATRYTSPTQTIFKSHLGINIRGGKPGFLRITQEGERQVAYLPDYSGNRFMSSLGNIYSDRVAGLTIPLMRKGKPIDVVYLTGDATVLLGTESSKIFPGVSTCVRVEITGFMHVQDAVPLLPGDGVEDFEQKGEDGIGWSPYNPPVRRLRDELTSSSDPTTESSSNFAALTNIDRHSEDLATFTFVLDHPVTYRAGQHIILDCSSLLDAEMKQYKHMSDKLGGEKELNDSGVRTWTMSSAPKAGGEKEGEIKVTMRRVEAGAITPKLFDAAAAEGIKLGVLGIGGDFVLSKEVNRMLWVASGVGITPFLSFLSSLTIVSVLTDITMILAVRRAEAKIMLELIQSAISSGPTSPKGSLKIHVVSPGLEDLESKYTGTVKVHDTRLNPALLLELAQEGPREGEKVEAWVCGPPLLETEVLKTLEGAGWGADQVHRESFAF